MRTTNLAARIGRIPNAAADTAHILFGAGAELVWNEAGTLRGLRADLAERIAAARESHDMFDLIDAQLDLWPETRLRLRADQQRRLDTVAQARRQLALVGSSLRMPATG